MVFYADEQGMNVISAVKNEWFVFIAALIVACGILAFGRDDGRVPVEDSAAPLAGYEELLPHRALYKVKMKTVRSGAQIVNVSGELVYEWRPVCGGVISDYHFDMHYDYSDAQPLDVKSHVANFEPYDQAALDFVTRRFNNGHLFQSVKGRANFDESLVRYDLPSQVDEPMEQGVLSPTAYTLRVVEAIRAGEVSFSGRLFDGSDNKGPIWINSLIGREAEAGVYGAAVAPEALGTPARHVHMAFFSGAGDDSMPDYEMNAIFHLNGVMRSVQIEYDDFSVVQELVSLDVLEGGCK